MFYDEAVDTGFCSPHPPWGTALHSTCYRSAVPPPLMTGLFSTRVVKAESVKG